MVYCSPERLCMYRGAGMHVISRMSCLQHAINDLIHTSATLTINLNLNLSHLSSHILDITKSEVTPSRIHLSYLASYPRYPAYRVQAPTRYHLLARTQRRS
jgi:hypothetical protein